MRPTFSLLLGVRPPPAPVFFLHLFLNLTVNSWNVSCELVSLMSLTGVTWWIFSFLAMSRWSPASFLHLHHERRHFSELIPSQKKDTRTYQLESRMIFCCCSSLNPSPPLLCLKQIWVLLMTEMLKWFFSAVEILLVDEPESRNGSKVKPVEHPVMFRPEGGQQVDLFSTRRRSKDHSGLDLISYLHFNLCGISK